MHDGISEGVFAAVTILLFILFAQILGRMQKRKYEAAVLQRLAGNFGKAPDKKMDPERYAKVPAFFLRHRPEDEVDDITWNDLEMDRIYQRMDATLSGAGEEYLYALLRSPASGDAGKDRLQIPQETIRYFEREENRGVREKLQRAFYRFGHAGKFSLYEYLEMLDDVPKENNLVHLPAFLLPLVSIVILMVNVQAGILCLIGSLVLNMVTYYHRKGQIDPYLTSLAYLLRMMRCAGEVTSVSCPVLEEEKKCLQDLKPVFADFRRGSGVVLSGSSVSGGNPLDIVMDYVRILFHLDLIRFNSMLSLVRAHQREIDLALTVLGRIDTAISLASFEKSLPVTCIPEFTDGETQDGTKRPSAFAEASGHGEDENRQRGGELCIRGLYHPLLADPVPNSIDAKRPVLLTGSNASGKSTFLKAAALCAILAQTIGFCPAEGYRGVHYRIRSSMALRDNILNGESYFMVEIRSLKRIADLSADGGRKVLCFVDEVLRGTNTVERIAASTEILRTLAERGVLCFAATHDIELTRLLEDQYDNYHFEEELKDGDVVFSYELHPGRATTRNAIRLLDSIGFDREVTRRAAKRAEEFEKTGKWMPEET